ncbi:hypothetical protein [Kosakonia radicincitans]|uniref:ParE family toxin-like protein n=1 Tax=Kosakonia radicincitans TaxID=283686 RepID=UPI00055D2A8D|nr:hypothetical protein [Kosakonia radicincitans]
MQLSDFKPRQQISPSVRRHANQLFDALCGGKKVYCRLNMNGYLKMNVGPFWRILSKDGVQWWLMDHETYNREIRK